MISIIIPVFNSEKWVLECINSILCQTYNSFELLLVNDGSTDKSGFICDEYAKKDNRIRVFHQENGGVSLARYNGVKKANGEWIMFVDADDYIPSDALQKLIDNAANVDMVTGSMAFIQESTKEVTYFSPKIKEEGTFCSEEYIKGILTGSRMPNLFRQLIKASILKEHIILIPRNIRIFEDFLLNIQIGLHLNNIKGISDIVYYYRLQPQSTVHTMWQTMDDADEVDRVLNEILKGRNEYQEAIFRHRLIEARRFVADPDFKNSSLKKGIICTANKFKKTIGEKYLIFLCRINNNTIRKMMWNSFLYIVNISQNLKKGWAKKK